MIDSDMMTACLLLLEVVGAGTNGRLQGKPRGLENVENCRKTGFEAGTQQK
jgi:hypothetical protein